MHLRPYQDLADATAMQRLASRLWPLGMHPGGLGWEAATNQLPSGLVLAFDAGLAGWAGWAGDELIVTVDPACPDAARALVDRALADRALREAPGGEPTVAVADVDDAVRSAVTSVGFVTQPGSPPVSAMFRDTSEGHPGQEPPGQELPSGYLVRSVRDDEFDERVAVHRAAWRPAGLPWPNGVPATVSADATSRFTDRLYHLTRETWLYDQDLDLVVQAPDGTLAACCIAWWDPSIATAEIEPLGVAPAHRRKGLASALCEAVTQKVAARGGTQVFINVSDRPDYPAPAQTYLSAGFTQVPRARHYQRPGAA